LTYGVPKIKWRSLNSTTSNLTASTKYGNYHMESLVGEERLLNILKDIIEISWVDQ